MREKKVEDIWIRGTNDDVYELYNKAAITKFIKKEELSGQVIYKEWDKKDYSKKQPGKSQKEKEERVDQKKFRQAIMKDLQDMTIKDWKKMKINRKYWRKKNHFDDVVSRPVNLKDEGKMKRRWKGAICL